MSRNTDPMPQDPPLTRSRSSVGTVLKTTRPGRAMSSPPKLETKANPKERTERFERFLKKYPKAESLVCITDLELSPNEILIKLKDRFISCGFAYDMSPVKPDAFLGGARNGDCSTLARSYQIIALECYEISVSLGEKLTEFYVEGGGQVTGGPTGNVDGGKHWVFTNHYWVETSAGNFDLLFLGAAPNKGGWVLWKENGTEEYNGKKLEFRIFGNTKVYSAYTTGPLPGRYSLSPKGAEVGQKQEELFLAELKLKEKEEARKEVERQIGKLLKDGNCPSVLWEAALEIIRTTKLSQEGTIKWDDPLIKYLGKQGSVLNVEQWNKWVDSGGSVFEEPKESDEEIKTKYLIEIKEILNSLRHFPKDLIDQTAERLLKVYPGGDTMLLMWMKGQASNFLDVGGLMTISPFNKEKWEKWIRG